MSLVEPDIEAWSGKRTLAQGRAGKRFALASIPLFVIGAGVGAPIGGNSGLAITILGCIFGGMMLLIGGIIWLLTRKWQKHVNDMAAGDCYVHWVYGDEQWAAYVESERRRNRWSWAVIAGLMALSGLVVAGLMSADGDHIGDQPVLTWTVMPVGLFLAGAIIGWTIQFCIARSLDRMARDGGEVFIGPHGVYISGTFWPWKTAGQYVTNITHQQGPPDTIVFRFHIYTGKGSHDRDVNIPVPLGREAEVPGVLAKIG